MLDPTNPIPHHPPPSALRALLKSEAGGGVVLMLAAAIALVIANSPLAPAYFRQLKTYVGGLYVWSQGLMVHSSRWNGRMRYGPSSSWERPHDGGSASRDPA